MDNQKVNGAVGARETGHSLLSASSAHRWLNCPPSARLGERVEDRGSDYAAEGTAAHILAEYKLKVALGIPASDPTPDLTYYDGEMEEMANGYAAYILEQFETAKQDCADPEVHIEKKLDFSKYVAGGFGTADCLIVADGTLRIVDFKYGQGVRVAAEDNPQLQLYALAALEIYDGIYDIDRVAMTIFQPRRDNVSTHTVGKESLYQWAEEVLKPAAALAYAGDGEFKCGEWCQFCKVKDQCRARAQLSLELARYDFRLPPLLEDEEVEEVLGKLDALISWASDLKGYALQAALGGKEWKGWKLVAGRSTRRYTDEAAVADTVTRAGFDPYEHRVLGITAMTSLLGRKRFAELLEGLVEKPPGKPVLVPDTDKRPAVAIPSAADDFQE
jgi:hypothetical protein